MRPATPSGRTRRTPVRPGRSARSARPDKLCADAVELAREAVEAAAGPGRVGEYIEAVADGDRVVTHFFECQEDAYRGWRWAATVARASRAKHVTLDETVLLPGPEALLAPEWVPWSERLRPGDLGPGDLLPTEADDLRLEPGVAHGAGGASEPVAAEVAPAGSAGAGAGEVRPSEDEVGEPSERSEGAEPSEGAGPSEGAEDGAGVGGTGAGAGVGAEPGAESAGVAEPASAAESVSAAEPAAVRYVTPPPSRGEIVAVGEELGMGRPRVLSRYGVETAADRWEEQYGSGTPMAQSAPASCMTCGFLMPLAGRLRQAFGVCANEYSPADGHVVSLAYGCGGHSEAAVMPRPPQPPPPVIDETRADELYR